ncbi:hypothetical protein AJ78_07537 [Emergomyces pasteurianus Ep9510]|uniref:Uncharacterized protein n=1 Tax=Emergomyces pasteurianus Ep9510 TaxID=1447872 RepID=A0A1J9Q746_9EURO|nr:hypothetical protein AJ78_07537 [Emergomyces pasteurianus Ep9510]
MRGSAAATIAAAGEGEPTTSTIFQINVQSTANTLNELQLKLHITHNQFLNSLTFHVLHGRAPEYDPDSLIDKKITTFLRTVESVLKSLSLSDSSNYLTWREFILSYVETTKCHLILKNSEEDSSFNEETIF